MYQLVEFFKLLSDETRLRIIILLAHGDLYVCQISGIMNLSQPKISKHLSKLRELDYVKTEKKEKFILYSLNLINKEEGIKCLIKDIVNDITNYPQLDEDKQRLVERNKYLCQCKTNIKALGE